MKASIEDLVKQEHFKSTVKQLLFVKTLFSGKFVRSLRQKK